MKIMAAHPDAGRWILCGVSMVVYGVIVTYADPMLLFIIVYGFGLWVVMPIATVIIIVLLIMATVRRRSSFRLTRYPLLLFVVVGFLAVAALPINTRLQDWAVESAKAYPSRVAPLLKQYRQQHGKYPSTLDELPSHPRPPRLLRTKYGYQSDGPHYEFHFPQPGGMIDTWDYSSENQTWHLST